MSFERSLEIECRLDDVFRLIRTGRFSTPMLAEEVVVSIISRCVTALRLRGHDIRAEKSAGGWSYILARTLPNRHLKLRRTGITSQPTAPGQ